MPGKEVAGTTPEAQAIDFPPSSRLPTLCPALPPPADAILGNGSGIDYERQRYARALTAASGSSSGSSGAAAAAVLEAAPLTAAWMRQVVREVC